MCTCLANRQSPDLITASRNGSRATVCGRPRGQPQHCSALFRDCSRKITRPSAIDYVVPVHPSRCSPFHRPSRCTQYIHERLLLIAFIGEFCNPSHVLDVCSIHLPENRINRIELALGATFNRPRGSCCVISSTSHTSGMLPVSQSLPVLKTSRTLRRHRPSAPLRRFRRLLSRSSPRAVCTGLD